MDIHEVYGGGGDAPDNEAGPTSWPIPPIQQNKPALLSINYPKKSARQTVQEKLRTRETAQKSRALYIDYVEALLKKGPQDTAERLEIGENVKRGKSGIAEMDAIIADVNLWEGITSFATDEQVATPAITPKAPRDIHRKACPGWLDKELRRANFMGAVTLGAEAKGRILVPGVDFSASGVVLALKKLDLIPQEKDDKTMRAAIREFYSSVAWTSREKGVESVDDLVESFREGTRILQQQSEAEVAKARQEIKLA